MHLTFEYDMHAVIVVPCACWISLKILISWQSKVIQIVLIFRLPTPRSRVTWLCVRPTPMSCPSTASVWVWQIMLQPTALGCCSPAGWVSLLPHLTFYPPEMTLWTLPCSCSTARICRVVALKKLTSVLLLCHVDRNKEIWLYRDISQAEEWINMMDCVVLILIETASLVYIFYAK